MSKQVNWDAVARALETSQRDAQRRRGLLSAGWWLLVGAFACGFGLLLNMSVQQLIGAWRSSEPQDWDTFWQSAFGLLRVWPLAILSRVNGLWALTRLQQGVLAIRQRVAEGNDERAPIAADQPLVLPHKVVSDEHEIGPLSRPRSGRRETADGAAAILIVVSMALAPISLMLSLIYLLAFNGEVAGRVISLISVAITVSLGLGAARVHRTAHALGQDIQVIADEHGLKWRRPAARNRFFEIPWSQSHAFFTVRFLRQSDEYFWDMFILECPGAVLAWEVSKRSTAEQRAAHELLSCLIAARTHLPLRDLTSAVEAALSPAKQEEPKPALTFPLPRPGSNPVQAAELPITIVERNDPSARAERRSARLGFTLSIVFILPVVVLYGTGWRLQQYQPRFYADLDARVHAETPLFQDSLTHDDGRWFNDDSSPEYNPETYFYTGGAYHIVGKRSDQFMYAWTALSNAGDAAVEATVSAANRTNDDRVGIMLHANQDSARIFEVFQIDTYGNWSLWRYNFVSSAADLNWNQVAGDYTSAAHQGAGARNRLLAIQRGSQFLLYVNDHFVGLYSDAPAPRSGLMGVYVDSSSTEGIFSKFTVYPAPPATLLGV